MPQSPWERTKSGSEFGEQSALFIWATMAQNFGVTAANNPASYSQKGFAQTSLEAHGDAVPELQWLFAVKNQGHGDAIRGGQSRAEGVKAGVSDIFFPLPRNVTVSPGMVRSYAGLFIEMKREKGGIRSQPQIDFTAYANQVGYRAVFCEGWQAAAVELLRYLGRSPF